MGHPGTFLGLGLFAACLSLGSTARCQVAAPVDFDGRAKPRSAIETLRQLNPVPVPVGARVAFDRYGDQHDYDRDGYGYDHGRRRPYWDWERVKALAHQVEAAAGHVHREAEERAHHGDYDERRALADLHRLEEAAEHFHRQVERYRQDPSHTRSDYYSLLSAFRQARSSIRYAHAERHVQGDFARMERALSELEHQYRDGGYHGRDDDHGHGGYRRRPRPWGY